jgi:hypothetical protein
MKIDDKVEIHAACIVAAGYLVPQGKNVAAEVARTADDIFKEYKKIQDSHEITSISNLKTPRK